MNRLFLFGPLVLVSFLVGAQPTGSALAHLRAVYHEQSESIIVDWQSHIRGEGVSYTVRYRLKEEPQWRYIRTAEVVARIPASATYKNGDELVIQVQIERKRQVIEHWSQELIVTINKKIAMESVGVNEGDMLPPLEFTAHVLGPTSVRLEWKSNQYQPTNDVYYIVNIKQLTSESGTALQRQQIKTTVNSFSLGKLIPGEKYEMTIRSASNSSGISSSTAAILEINMPRTEDFFEIGNVIISSHFKGTTHGSVNLTWEVPAALQGRIIAYNIHYSEVGSDKWQKVQFHGSRSSAQLTNLKSNTEYMLRIKTVLANNVHTESGEFKFRTPKVDSNPIQKVDVIYSHEVNAVRLQWILDTSVHVNQIAGYDVYISEDKDRPDSQWRLVRLTSREASLSLDDLKSSTVYYVRVNVRYVDGSVQRAPSIYRFKTIEQSLAGSQSPPEGNSLAYRNVGPGQVLVSWTYPNDILDRVIGSTILYTDRKDISPEQWSKVDVNDSRNTSITLNNLRQGARYSVQIIPLLYTGEKEYAAREQFEMKTDQMSSVTGQVAAARHPASPPQFEQITMSDLEYMRVVSCNPDAILSGCSWDEMCISRVEDRTKGWCISHTLRDSVLNS